MLCHLSKDVREWASSSLSGDELKGAAVVADAMVAPTRTIVDNAGRNGQLSLSGNMHTLFSSFSKCPNKCKQNVLEYDHIYRK